MTSHLRISVPAGALAAACLLASCFSTSSRGSGPQQVDDLLGRIEQLQASAVLSQERSRTAVELLQSIVDPGFAGDVVVTYGELVEAIQRSEDQAQLFKGSLSQMKRTAQSVFGRWVEDLDSYQSTEMRRRSQARLEEARRSYDSIVTAADAVLWEHDAFNSLLRDHALFLRNDLNAAAVAEIADGVRTLAVQADQLSERLDACAKAARSHVESFALVGQFDVAGAAGAATDPR